MRNEKGNAFVTVIIFVLLLAFLVSVFLAAHFSFPTKARAEERSLADLQRQVVINLSEANSSLADRFNGKLDEDAEPPYILGECNQRFFYDKQTGRKIGVAPNSIFFFMVADLTRRATEIKYDEVFDELMKHDYLFREALK